MEPIAYLALEIKQRELDSRLLIAAHLLKAGLPVVMGQQWSIFANCQAFPPGAILFKTVNKIQAANMANFHAEGYLVAATDEEVLVCFEDACFFEVFSDVAANNCDLFFAQSEVHKTAVERRFPALRGKTQVAGSSRIDFLSSWGRKTILAEAQQLRQTHGRYFLFNTNYGQMNSIWPDLNYVISIAGKAGLMNPDDPASVEEYRQKLEWERRNMREIVQLLHWTLSNIKDYKIVMRPHPGERADFWQEEFGRYPNFLLVPRSNPHPWLLASKLVVHTSCTTGLEAALLGRPTLNLVPIPHPTFDYITNYVNPSFKTWQQAAEAIGELVNVGTGSIISEQEKYQQALDAHFPNHASGLSSRCVADGVLNLLASHGVKPDAGYKLTFRGGGFTPIARNETLKDKFTVSANELIEAMRRVASVAGLTFNADIAPIDDSLFLMSPN